MLEIKWNLTHLLFRKGKCMLISAFESFQQDIQSHWASIVREDMGNPGKNPLDAARRAYDIYKNTYHGNLPFILLGANRIRENIPLVDNMGLVTAGHEKKKKNSQPIQGSILGEKQWSQLINDVFILGGMHGGKEFHLISDGQFPALDSLWNAKKNCMRSLGRELAILKLSGYQLAQTDAGHPIAFSGCMAGDKIPRSFSELQIKLKTIRSFTDFQNLLGQAM